MTQSLYDADGGENDGTTTTPTSWIGWKDRGAQAYTRGDYGAALQAYTNALSRDPPVLDRQRLLSNLVACRLHLGGAAQAEAAVVNARACIALNDRWAKGHVRLAEAYIALGRCDRTTTQERTARSNDACNALQTALRLDPGNPTARDLLVRELRSGRDRGRNPGGNSSSNSSSSSSNRNGNGNGNGNGSSNPQPSAPPHHMDDNGRSGDNTRPQHPAQPNRGTTGAPGDRRQPFGRTTNANAYTYTDHIDDSDGHSHTVPWHERLLFRVQRARAWYSAQSENVRSLLAVALVLVLLYVAFGGRFGLEYFLGGNASGNTPSRGSSYDNRASRNTDVYQEFYRSRNTQGRDRYGHRDRASTTAYDASNSNAYSGHTHRSSSSSSSSYFGGKYSNALILAAAAYGAQWFGIRPHQAIWFVNMLMGRRGGGFFRRPRGFGGGGGGFNYYGGGGNARHRPGGMWR